MTTPNDDQANPDSAEAPSVEGVGLGARNCSEFFVLKLTNLKLIACRDRLEMQDAVRALRERDIGYIVLRWHAGANTYVQPEVME